MDFKLPGAQKQRFFVGDLEPSTAGGMANVANVPVRRAYDDFISNAQSSDPYKAEKKLMRVKHYDTMKFPALPKRAAEARPFRNSVFNVVCKLAKTDETPVFAWIQECMNPNANLANYNFCFVWGIFH
jgi:hypothetical protein